MKHNCRILHVVHPGIAAGVAFVTAYEIDDFNAAAHELTPVPAPVATAGVFKREWMQAMNRLVRALRRRLPAMLRRPAAV